MKNLKRALSFALATVMVIGMMVVGAGAAFTDADKIVNDDAVDAMVALGVFNGKGDGTYFDPAGTLTRAEAAKIIVFALHGGKAPVIGTKATPSYSDIKGNWAESYIEYCSSLGIIAGWDGKFNPTGTLTGEAFAKMLMVAMGYKAEVFGFTGNDWAMNVNIEANKIGLYEDLDAIDPAKDLSRDDACLMAYNALFAGIMEKSYTHDLESGKITNGYSFVTTKDGTNPYNLFTEKFGGESVDGYLVDADYNPDTKEYTYYIDKTSKTDDGVNDNAIVTTEDFTALIGLKVTALYKTASDGTELGYGIYADCNTVTATLGEAVAIAGTAGEKKVKLAGTEYKLETYMVDTDVLVYTNASGVVDTAKDLDDANPTYKYASTLTLVDVDDNNKYDYAVIVPVDVKQVSYVGLKGITATGSYTYENDTIEAGLKKDDYVTIIAKANTVYDKNVIAKVELTTGKVEGIKDTDDILVNGKWYEDYASLNPSVALGNTYKFAAVGAYYYSMERVYGENTLANLVYVIDTDDSMQTVTAKFMTSAGETVIKTVTKVGGSAISAKESLTADKLYTYKEVNGNWELTAVHNTTNNLGYKFDDTTTPDFTEKNDTTGAPAMIGTYYIADDAVIFVAYESTKDKVISGADLAKWNVSTTYDLGADCDFLYKTVNGLNYVVAAKVDISANKIPASTGKETYGYVVSVPYSVKIDNTGYTCFTMWTGSETVTVLDKDNGTLSDYAKGDTIKYDDLGNGYVQNTVKQVGTTTGAAAVMGYTDKVVSLADNAAAPTGTAYTIDEDTVIMYVDSKAVAGAEGGAIALAAETADGEYICNVWYVVDGTVLDLLVVDVANDLYHATNEYKTNAPA